MKLIQLSLFLLILLESCVGPNALQYKLNESATNLDYTFDSLIDTIKGNNKIYLRVIDSLKVNDFTNVEDNGSLLVPLGIGGGYKYDFTVTLGKKSVQPSFSEFINNSFRTEVARSGDFHITDKSRRSDYILEIKLIECQISTKYHKDRIRFGHNNKENWILKPVTGNFKVEAILKKKKKVIYQKEYSSNKSAQPEIQAFSSEYAMNKKMMNDFGLTASLEIKEINEQIIKDLDEYLKQNTAYNKRKYFSQHYF